jgi:hypothetical protein
MSDIRRDEEDAKVEPLPDALRWELRALRRDAEPATDLWPSIAQRLSTTPQHAATPTIPTRRRNVMPFAVAASLALAMGFAWQLRPVPSPAAGAATDPQARLITREADAMTLEYQAAIREFNASRATPIQRTAPELEVLDRSAAQIRTAITRAPESRFLLDSLQRTYIRRLELTQRLALDSLAS